MARRDSGEAQAAANAASEAARVMQARQQEVRAEKAQETPEPPSKSIMKEEEIANRRRNPRNDVLEDIAARRGPQPSEEEKAEKPKAEAKAEPKAEEPKAAESKAEQPAAEAPAAEPTAAAPKTVRVKVDGEEFDAPEEEVEAAGGVRSYQIQRASENRLRKANEVLERAQKAQGDLTPLVTALLQAKAPPKAPEPTDAEFIKSKMDIIRYGSDADGAAALQEILGRIAPKPVDQNALVSQATDRINHDQAVRKFDQKFKDITTNPVRLAAANAVRMQKIGYIKGPVDWDSFYDSLGNEVRSAFGGQSQPAAAPAAAATGGNPSPTSEKEARKASIVNLPAAAARAELPKEDRPETREEILNEMRRSRGLPVG